MPDDKTKTPPEANSKARELTAADAAKRVKRTVTEWVDGEDKAGKPVKTARTREVAVQAADVLSFRDYGTHVVVVTTDGQKLSSLGE